MSSASSLLPLPLDLVATGVLVAFLAWVVQLIRRNRLNLRESLSWLLSTGVALLMTLFPSILKSMADLLHVAVPSNALFAVAFVYVLLNLLTMTVTTSSHAGRIRRLTQECALLRAEIEELRARLGPGVESERDGGGATPRAR